VRLVELSSEQSSADSSHRGLLRAADASELEGGAMGGEGRGGGELGKAAGGERRRRLEVVG
jgi:hypothetical protein